MANYRPQHLFPFDQAQNMGLWYFSHSIYQIYETEKQNHRKACQDFVFFLFLPHPAKLAQLKDPSFKSFFSTLLWVWDQRPKIPFSNSSQIYLCFTKLYTVLYRLRKRYCVLIVLPLKQLNSRQLIISNNEHFPRKSPSCGAQYHGELLKTSLNRKFPQLASWTGDNWILSNFISKSTSGAAPNTIKDKNSIWHMIQMLWLIYWY